MYCLQSVIKEHHMINRCVRKDSMSCDPSHITCGFILMQQSYGFLLSQSFIIFMYINKILMKTTLQLFIFKCELLCIDSPMKTFTCRVGLDFNSGSAYEDPMAHTPYYIMWSTQNHAIKLFRVHNVHWNWLIPFVFAYMSHYCEIMVASLWHHLEHHEYSGAK